MSYINDNLNKIENRIAAACDCGNRVRNEVLLIAVSKTKPIELLNEAYQYGIRDFGENRVQELSEKAQMLPEDIHWHMIGHLQKNKVKQAVRYAYMIHSVDSPKLAAAISKEAVKAGRVIPVLIEVNVAEEESKFGIKLQECENFIRSIHTLPGITVRGLMTIAPFTDNGEENREYFRALKQLSVDIMHKNIDNVSMDFLSMGMSGDYRTAIEEGADLVRVGTRIFGEREYMITT